MDGWMDGWLDGWRMMVMSAGGRTSVSLSLSFPLASFLRSLDLLSCEKPPFALPSSLRSLLRSFGAFSPSSSSSSCSSSVVCVFVPPSHKERKREK